MQSVKCKEFIAHKSDNRMGRRKIANDKEREVLPQVSGVA